MAAAGNVAAAPFREAEFMPVDLDIDRRADGTIVLRSRVPLGRYEPNLAKALAASIARQPDKSALAFRGPDGEWQHTSYADFGRQVDAATQWLLGHVPRGRAVIVLAGNTLPAAVLTFACYAAGVIHCPVGLAYGMAGGDHARLRHVIAKTAPALIYTDAHPVLAAAVTTVAGDVPIVCTDAALIAGATPWSAVVGTVPTTVAAAIAAVDPHAIASYMLTSGSTGLPKVVPVSQDNIAACTKQGLIAIGKAAGWGGTMLDWLPWHHAAGASVLRATLLEGGTLFVDAGKPAPGLFDATIANLREIPVAYFNNVPLGYAMLVDAMETDAVLRRQFFKKLRLMLYGGAGLPQHVLDRLQAMAVAETGHRIHMTTGYGMTETVTGCMVIHFPTDKVGIGLPTAALEVKLVPHDARYEVRLRGPNVMAGYLDEPVKNREAFDDEGFYRTGDLALFHDPEHPEQGLVFAGRLAEEFKLSNGNWVYGGQLREGLLKALAGVASEVVLCDDGRDYLALLAWPVAGAALDAVTERLSAFNAAQRGSGATIRRVRLLTSPPSADANEISDKGTINRRAVLDHRGAEVAA
ncbi:MAG: AMP-binding protein, partial [Sandarakinorhabdus sp.]|nr:AMP-binding protein [Sandarakinorhabdus sp.]